MEIKRDILHDLKRWKERHDRKPLIVHGARQIGKTTAIRAFGKECYEYVAEFNFDKQRELADIFSKTKDPSRIITELASTCRSQSCRVALLYFLTRFRNVRTLLIP